MADTMVLTPCSGLYAGKKRVAVGARQRYAGEGALGSPPRPQPGRLPLPDPPPGGSTRPSPVPARNGRSWDRVYDALRAWRAQQGIQADMPIRGRRMNSQPTPRHGARRAMPSSHRPAGERPPYIRAAPSRQAEQGRVPASAGRELRRLARCRAWPCGRKRLIHWQPWRRIW